MSDAESREGSPAEPVEDHAEDGPDDNADGGDGSDKESDVLSEIDEEQFDDYAPNERPVEIDEAAVKTLKASKRKRNDGEASKKSKEGRRAKKRARDEDDDVGGYDGDDSGERPRKARAEAKARRTAKRATPPEEDDEHLSPEERRRRALDRQIDAAIKNPSKRRRKKDEEDLENEIDEHIASLKERMIKACKEDNTAHERGEPAVHKLRLLPEVMSLLNRTSVQHAVLDPESNFLESVKYFLEPVGDESNIALPAYSIQRDLFTALMRLPIEREALLSSGIGKIVMLYSRSKQPEASIKRMAERLIGEWSRLILNRTDDYKKRHIQTRDFDYSAAKLAQRQEIVSGSQFTLTQRPAATTRWDAERQQLLAPVVNPNRAQPAGLPTTYTIAPRSTFDGTRGSDHRPIGASGTEAFRRMTQKSKGKK